MRHTPRTARIVPVSMMKSPGIATIPPPARRANTILRPGRTNSTPRTEPRRSSGAPRAVSRTHALVRSDRGVPSCAACGVAKAARCATIGGGCQPRRATQEERARSRVQRARPRGRNPRSREDEREIPPRTPSRKKLLVYITPKSLSGVKIAAHRRDLTHHARPHAPRRAHAAPRCPKSFASPSCTKCCIGPWGLDFSSSSRRLARGFA